MAYTPPKEILKKYAEVLIKFALNDGRGIKRGEVVYLEVPECAKPLLIELQKTILKEGGHYITNFIPDEMEKHFYELAEEHQLNFFPHNHLKGRVDQADHFLYIIAEVNKKELEGIDPKRIMAKQRAHKPYREWRNEKEMQGKMTWTLALYATEDAAKEANISIEEYWNQIINACYLNEKNPILKWNESFKEINRVLDTLNSMKIKNLHIKSDKIDLNVGIDENRKWLGGSGRNIPSFEVFISPDWRKTNGEIFFDQPLYRYGNLITNVYLKFKDGIVTESKAEKGQDVLKEMIATENADKIGEFSLTDKRLSKIDKFMAETLFDENFGGKYGNTHVALGSAYKDSFPGDQTKVTKEQWADMGYNESVVHTDIISTENRVVTATLQDGSKKVIYENGKFVI